jgi:hypothetical protein
MVNPVRVIVVDPFTRTCIPRVMTPSNSHRDLKALLKTASSRIGWRRLLEDVDGEILFVACRANTNPDKLIPEWRLRGGENTAGRGILFGSLNKESAGMWHVPASITPEWLEKRIIWCEPGENASVDEMREAGTLKEDAPVAVESEEETND